MITKEVRKTATSLVMPSLWLGPEDADTLALMNLAKTVYKDFKLGNLKLWGVDAATGAGNIADSTTLTLRASYRDGSNALTDWNLTLLHDMVTGGATPASSALFKINGVTVLTLTNTNGTPSMTLPGDVTGPTGTWRVYGNSAGQANFGIGDSNRIGISGGSLLLVLGNIQQVGISDGVFAFSKAYSITTDAGALTLKPAAGFITKQVTTASPMAVLTTTASDTLQTSDDTEKSTVELGYTKIKQILLEEAQTGTTRIKFALKTAGGGATATARIYKNGVALGTEQTDVTGGYVEKIEDLGPFVAGDLIQVYAKTSNGSWAAYVQNLRLCYTASTVVTALKATNQDP